MNYFKLIIAYDGTDYAGWHPQPHKKTIFETLYNTISSTFSTYFQLVGASRTDSGVHAKGQVARIKTPLSISPKKLLFAWNNVLPKAIQIIDIEKVTVDFHPWHNIAYKTYDYYIFTKQPTPFHARFGWYYPYTFNEKKLQKALMLFVGTHNFAAFTKAQDTRKNTIRTIKRINSVYVHKQSTYIISITGNAFMWNMVRRIVGAALGVMSNNNFNTEMIKDLLITGNPNHPLPNAPACGLLLKEIVYNNHQDIK